MRLWVSLMTVKGYRQGILLTCVPNRVIGSVDGVCAVDDVVVLGLLDLRIFRTISGNEAGTEQGKAPAIRPTRL
ncbi:MAG: hypothetical protein K0U36_02430 [Alphaproteobacteria bacterium]|nr:hypothetical protein [Alphaproteobacteria bacterium]